MTRAKQTYSSRRIASNTSENYLEFKIPVREPRWLSNLALDMLREKISVCWQNAFYHITIVFVHDDTHILELQKAFDRVLTNRKAPRIEVDKLDAFQTQNGKEIILCLAPSQPTEELIALIKDLLDAAKATGANINPSFRIHITLGRIKTEEISLEQIQKILDTVTIKPIKTTIRDVTYLYRSFGHKPIAQWTLSER